jgi:hypothetical protein
MGAMGIGHPIWNLTNSYFAFRQLSAFHIFLPPKTQKGRGLFGHYAKLFEDSFEAICKIPDVSSRLMVVEPLGPSFPQGISVE